MQSQNNGFSPSFPDFHLRRALQDGTTVRNILTYGEFKTFNGNLVAFNRLK